MPYTRFIYEAKHIWRQSRAQPPRPSSKILDHYGVVGNQPIGALAHLGLARAYTLQGDTPKARAAYSDFLSLWKNAYRDVPLCERSEGGIR